MGTWGYFPEGEVAKVKNVWSYTSTPSICLHGAVLCLKKKDSASTSLMKQYTDLYKKEYDLDMNTIRLVIPAIK
jgi:hypothetical protein